MLAKNRSKPGAIYPGGAQAGCRRTLARICAKSLAYGQASEYDNQTLRTVMRIRAAIFSSFRRMVVHCAFACCVPAKPSRRNPCMST